MDTGLKLLIQNLKSPLQPSHYAPMSLLSLRQLTSHFNIRQKIGLGFGLAIGVMMLGLVAGRALDFYYWQYAQQQLSKTDTEVALVMNLQTLLLQVHAQEQQLLESDATNLIESRKQVERLLAQALNIHSVLQEIEVHLQNEGAEAHQNQASKIRALHHSRATINAYIVNVSSVLEKAKATDLSPQQIQALREVLLALPYTSAAKDLDHVPEYLQKITERYEDEEEENIQLMNKAQLAEILLLLLSSLVTVTLATAIAIHISGVISLPIKMTTHVARRMAETSNFNLHAPVFSKDEIGQLAIALNQLIKRIKSHTEELKNTQTQLIQSEKMSSLGQMVAGIAHELNNPTSFIHGNLQHASEYVYTLLKVIQLYQREYPNPTDEFQKKIQAMELDFLTEDLEKTLVSMKIGTERIRKLVLSLRNFSRLDEAEVKAVDLHEGIENTLLILNHRLKQEIIVNKNYGNLPLVDCYPAQINQVFMNIINNAIDALLENSQNSQKQLSIQTQHIEADRVEIRIQDNGSGIPAHIKEKIFDPFFTTKEVGKGTGLGLAICYQVVNKHSGKICVNSSAKKGTEFVITLPIQQTSTPS